MSKGPTEKMVVLVAGGLLTTLTVVVLLLVLGSFPNSTDSKEVKDVTTNTANAFNIMDTLSSPLDLLKIGAILIVLFVGAVLSAIKIWEKLNPPLA